MTNLAGVDLNLLVALDALLTERSVTRAARKVGLSQPGMSNALARLRRLLDDPLFVREGVALTPTPRAEALVHPVRELLGIAQQVVDGGRDFDPARDARTFTISCSDYSLLLVVAPLIARYAVHLPGIAIQVLPRSPDAVRMLRDGDVDLVIEPTEILPAGTLESRPLFRDRWSCCVSASHPAVGDVMTLEMFLDLGHVIYSRGRGQPLGLADRHLEAIGLPRRVEFVVESFLLAPLLVQDTDLVTLVLDRAGPYVERSAGVRLLPAPVHLPVLTQRMWWHPRNTADAAHRWLRNRVLEVCAGMTDPVDFPVGAVPDAAGRGRPYVALGT
ncbi:LysR family transcriptional regulator [Modestobacter lapidis]|nr:LysR family transcriptional regulator [Modestobacter lapidis]